MRNESFTCESCGREVSLHPTGSARNHCSYCLSSKHVDADFPGDRAAECHGIMEAIAMDWKKGKGDMIRHKCKKCGKEMLNIVALDDDILGFVKRMNRSK